MEESSPNLVENIKFKYKKLNIGLKQVKTFLNILSLNF